MMMSMFGEQVDGVRCGSCQGSGTTITGDPCVMCHGTGRGGGLDRDERGVGSCSNCQGSGTTITGESCAMCHGTGKGSDPTEIDLRDGLEPVVRAGGWIKALLKAIWGGKSNPT